MKVWFKTVFTVIGSVVGAGFLSGRELLRFFGDRAYLPHILFCGAIFFFYLFFLLRIGGRLGGFEGAMEAIFGKNYLLKKLVQGVLLACSFIVTTAMLSGINALSADFSPYISLLTAVVCLLTVKRGIDGVGAMNTVLVPVMLGYLAFQLVARGQFSFTANGERSGMWIWTYVAMNIFLAVPVVMDCGKELRSSAKITSASAFISGTVCLFVGLILSALDGAEGAKGHTMPVFYLLKEGKLFALICYLGMVTTLISSYYPLHILAEKIPKGKDAARVGILVTASLFACLGLEKIVEYAYPLMGVAGLIFLTVVIFHDQFFEQSYQKIHRACQQAEQEGRRHHKV